MDNFTSKLYRKIWWREDIILKNEAFQNISNNLNPFWRDILLNLSELLPPKDEEDNNSINFLTQLIWVNFSIKRKGIIFIIEKYCYNGVFFINDIISEDQKFLSYQEFKKKIS